MQSLTEILFSSWIGVLTLFAIIFTILIGLWFSRWIKKNIEADEAAIARNDNEDQDAPPTN